MFSDGSSAAVAELQPLVAFPEPMARDYGSEGPQNSSERQESNRLRRLFFGFKPFGIRNKVSKAKYVLPVEIMTEDAALHGLQPTKRKRRVSANVKRDAVEGNEANYLKSKLWYLGSIS